MFVKKIFNRIHNGEGKELNTAFILILLGIIIVSASGIRLYQVLFDETEAPLFLQQEGLVQVATYEQAQNYLEQDYPLPTELFDSSISVIGVYTEAAEYYDQDTLVIAYEKNGWRFVQVLYVPNTSIEKELNKYIAKAVETVSINEATAYLVDVVGEYYQCIESQTEGIPGICTLTRSLLLPYEDTVIVLSADGPNASNGELITMAKSITNK
jgi:hypothetical protein